MCMNKQGKEREKYREHISPDNGGLVGRREERVLGYLHMDRLETALVKGDVLRDKAAQAVDNRGISHGLRGVDIA